MKLSKLFKFGSYGTYNFTHPAKDVDNVTTNYDNTRNHHEEPTQPDATETGRRRTAVKAQAVSEKDIIKSKVTKHPKSSGDELLIKNALSANDFLHTVLEGDRLQLVVDAMYPHEVTAKEFLINEGTVGSHLYVSASGSYEVTIKGKAVSTFQDSRVFGELAILYNAKRLASVQALKPGKVWILDRTVYQQAIIRNAMEERDELLRFLKDIPKLNAKSDETLARVANLLKAEFFGANAVIVRQGDRGDKFYIIRAGSVTINKRGEGDIGTMVRGQCFGELALLKEDCRQATVTADSPVVECLTLSRQEFIEHFGDMENAWEIPEPVVPIVEPESKLHSNIGLRDLDIVTTLGVGGFGRVELVQHRTKKNLTFALKYLKKIEMVQQQQQEHAFNEKTIQTGCNSIFIVRMYKTFRDAKYLYFLMEPCLGGDLWTLLQKQKGRRFEEGAARFFAACVLEALAYLHERNIVYRDLKPENLLLESQGYIKLTDFGFAKQLGTRGKTYTFAGTPEYVAPEIVLNRGHDRSVDYWALGVFIYELLVGKTPFRSNDASHMKTYNLILRGIENVPFPSHVTRSAQHLIKKLCRSLATDRLGCQKEGAQDVRAHKWFQGFDWAKLNAGQMRAPFRRPLKNMIDTQYFDTYPKDKDIPPDELSGWDNNF